MGAAGGAPGAQQFGGGGSLDFMNLSGSFGGTIASIGSKFGFQAAESFGMGLQGITLDNAIAGTYGGTAYNLGSTIGGWDASISKVPGFEGGFGSVLGYGSALLNLSEGKYGSALGTGLGTYLIPTLGPLAPVVGSTLGSLVDGMFGGGTPHAGAASMYSGGTLSGTGKQYTSAVAVTDTYNAAMQKPMDELAVSIGSALDGLAKQFSKPTGYAVGTGFKSDNDDPSAGRFIVTGPQGETLRQWEAYQRGELGARATGERYDKDPTKGFDQYLQSVTAATIPIMQDIVPDWADNLLDQLSNSLGIAGALASGEKNPWKQMSVSGQEALNALQDTLNAIVLTEQGFSELGQTMSMFSGISDDMKTALLGAFGSIQGVTEVAGSYYQNFYSEEERFRKAGETVNASLRSIGVQLDVFGGEAAKVQYRELVEKAFAEGNNELAAQLLQMSGAFAEVANAAEQATRALNDSQVAILKRFSDGAIEARDLQAQILAEDASKIWKDVPVDYLKETILTATSSDIEKYLREAWAYMDTTEAKQSLISLGNSLLDFTNSAEGASDTVSGLTDIITRELTAAFSAMKDASSVLEKIQSAMGIVTSSLSREAQLWEALGKADYRTQIEIASELSDLIIKRHQVEQQNAEKLLDFGKSLQAYVNSLKIGNLSTFTPAEKLAEAGKQYADTLKKAQTGDEDALRSLQGVSSSYLELARQYYASSDDYTRIFESVTNSLESLGVKSQSEAQMQLEVSSDSLNELKKLEAIVKQAYSSAETDFSVQKNLLQQQIDQMLRTADGIERVQALLAGLPYDISSQFNAGGVSVPGGGVGASSYEALARQYVSLVAPQGGPSDVNYVKQYAANIDQGQLDYELKAALDLLSDPEDKQAMTAIFKNIAQLRGLTINGSHANGLSYVPFDGYVAQLHEGERVLTAKENSMYTPSEVTRDSTEMSIMAAEIRTLNAKLDKLTEQNERLMTAQIRATVESNNSSSERVVEGITKATERAAYATTIEKGYR